MLQRLLATGALALASSLLVVPAALADGGTGTVSFFYAVPGAAVDIYLDDQELFTNVAPGTLSDPQALPTGDLEVIIVEAGTVMDGGKRVYEGIGFPVPARGDITLVARPVGNGIVDVADYPNDTSPSVEGGRLTVRHVAEAPAVDIRIGGSAVIKGLESHDESKLNLAAGTMNVDVVADGTDAVVLGPADVTVEDGKNLIVYAWGSLEDKNLVLSTQSVDLVKADATPTTSQSPASSKPDKPTEPGLPHTGTEGPGGATALAAALMAAVAIPGTAVLIARRRVNTKS